MRDADERLTRAVVFRIQKFSTSDGPGIRTAVYLKGCTLACRWCPRPEGISYHPELLFYPLRCIGCHDCIEACVYSAITPKQEGISINRYLCQACGTCALVCPAGALELVGQPFTPETLAEVIRQDITFFEFSGGGVTFAGGEAASHQHFLRSVAAQCREMHIHTALETCLIHEWATYRTLLPFINLWIVNLRLMESTLHRKGTGQGIWGILENIRLLASAQATMWIRTSIIPGWTDSPENIQAIGHFLRDFSSTIERWELIAPANNCLTNSTLGQVFEGLEAPFPVSLDHLNHLADLARESCGRQIPVVTSGPTLVGESG